MKILFILNYYFPYVSGVSEYARIIAENLAQKGCDCTVLCSNHAKLAPEETINGVKVIRAPIVIKISKGTVSPKFISLAKKLSGKADMVNMHLPMLESGIISKHIPKEKLFVTYHCDVNLPHGLLNGFIVKTMDRQHRKCLKKASKILVTTKDYAAHSRVLNDFLDKTEEVYAPIKSFSAPEENSKNSEVKTIGFCGRIVEEKGIDVLLRAYSLIRKKRSDVALKIGGDYTNVAGGSVYPALKTYIDENGIEDVTFIGKIPEGEMGNFYSSLDVFTLPSINSLEAFGMVQVEAMLCGAPVVASDLPGVRTIVQNTGMGLICRRGDAKDLADCILKILENPEKYKKSQSEISGKYSTEITVNRHMSIFGIN